jgi:hypothetical protein
MLMAGKQMRGLDFLAAGLIALVVIIILAEEILGWFIQKPVGGILTLAVVGILGYVYFSA